MYTSLHNHSVASALDGLNQPDRLVKLAKEMGMSAIGLTDHGTLEGVPPFFAECKKAGIKPIIGLEAYVVPDHKKKEYFKGATGKEIRSGYHLTLLARNLEGFRNLIRINNVANLEGFYFRPKADWDILAKYAAGITILTGCVSSEVSILSTAGQIDQAAQRVNWMREVFGGDHVFVEVMDNQMMKDMQRKANIGLIEVAKKTGTPIVATNDAHYLKAEHQQFHGFMFKANQYQQDHGKEPVKGKWKPREGYDGVYHLKSQAEMDKIFEAAWVENTTRVADQIETYDIFDKKNKLPNQMSDPDQMLTLIAQAGLNRRGMGSDPQYRARLERELAVIVKLGFSNYFLTTREIVEIIRGAGCPMGWGRGSGGSSLICYSLGITDVDPLHYGLLFERFISEDRPEWPDIDLDIPETRRDEILNKIVGKFGQDKVSHISVAHTFRPKMLIRDICRISGIDTRTADKWSDLAPTHYETYEDDVKGTDLETELMKSQQGKFILQAFEELVGVHRHVGVHASGVVISSERVEDFLPVRRDTVTIGGEKRSVLVTQYTMNWLDKFGFFKFDVLGLTKLDIIHGAANELGVDLKTIPTDDPMAFDLVSQGQVDGMFQLDKSLTCVDLCKQIKPRTMMELATILAINRPGVLGSGQYEVYLRRRKGLEEVQYVHPELADSLRDNYGICIFQEDLMQIARVCAGYTAVEAYGLMKGVGKKDMTIVRQHLIKFTERAKALGKIDDLEIGKVIQQLEAAGRYAFNKCLKVGTRVLTKTGWRLIEQIREGDKVISLDEHGATIEQSVVANHSNGVRPVYRVTLSNGMSVEATETHQFLSNEGYKMVSELVLGDILKVASDNTPSFAVDRCFNNTMTTPTQRNKIPNIIISDNSQRDNMVCAQSVPTQFNMDGFGYATNPTLVSVGLESVQSSASERDAFSDRTILSAAERMAKRPGSFYRGHLGSFANGAEFSSSFNMHLDGGGIDSDNDCDLRTTHAVSDVQIHHTIHEDRIRTLHTNRFESGLSQGVMQSEMSARQMKPLDDRPIGPSLLDHSFDLGEITPEPHSSLFAGKSVLGTDNSIVDGVGVPPLSDAQLAEQHSLLGMHHKKYPINEAHVILVEYAGEAQTYDLEMPVHHNFVANGVVSHNSHAVCYGYVTYACAWLSAHHPIPFFKWLITLAGDEDERVKYLSAAMTRGIPVLSPDINMSDAGLTAEDGGLRLGLQTIKGLGDVTVAHILAARPIKHADVLLKTVNRGIYAALYAAGAIDNLPGVENHPPAVRLEEMDVLGISLKGAQRFKNDVTRMGAVPFVQVGENAKVVLAFFSEVKLHKDKHKNTMAFVTLLDVHGPRAEGVVFASVYETNKPQEKTWYQAVISRTNRGMIVHSFLELEKVRRGWAIVDGV